MKISKKKSSYRKNTLRPIKKQAQEPDLTADDLICPITLELPIDPVMAEDGCVYDREAIEQYFKVKGKKAITSPLTRQRIGKKLVPLPETKTLIQALIESDIITGDVANSWKEKSMPPKKKIDKVKLLRGAEQGDVHKMEMVGHCYATGRDGFEKDDGLAFVWFNRAREGGGVFGMGEVGTMLFFGQGVAEDKMKGMYFLARAAENGCIQACLRLGMEFAGCRRHFGLPEDHAEAVRLLNLALVEDPQCCFQLLSKSRKEALRVLDDLRNGE